MDREPLAPGSLVRSFDWSELPTLRLRARSVADGVYAGMHRSPRRGAGVEFGGHREYVLGDDLRFVDRHALMRHGRLLIRQFETETDRTLCLVVDGSASMAFSSERAKTSKLAYASLLAAALARVALAGGDPVSLDWLGGQSARALPAMGGREAFERVIGSLETTRAGGDLSADVNELDRSLAPVARRAGRGSVVVLLSDLLDLPDGALYRFAGLGTRGRTVLAVRILDPLEATFSLTGPVRLRAVEGGSVVETNADLARGEYLEALEAIAAEWDRRLVERGGRLIRATTVDDPVHIVRSILLAAQGLGP